MAKDGRRSVGKEKKHKHAGLFRYEREIYVTIMLNCQWEEVAMFEQGGGGTR